MNRNQLLRLFPNATESTIAANADPDNSGTPPALECNPRHAPLGAKKVQRRPIERVHIVVTSVRRYDADDDNLCEKYHIDLLRYAGIIQGDSQKHCKIETSFRKAKKGEEEHTEITITKP
jgi:hypothetical protein